VFHEPVLVEEIRNLFITAPSGIYVDGTLGGGGHSEAILNQLSNKGRVIGFDLDAEAINAARKRLKQFNHRFISVQANFKDIEQVLKDLNIKKVQGVLLDLGISSHQIDTADRGFSFDRDAELDMRMNREQSLTAKKIVNTFSQQELSDLFKKYGEEKRHRAVARRIVQQREASKIETTHELKATVSKVLPFQQRAKSLARIFQALRIRVNQELQNLSEFLSAAIECVAAGGRIVIISYHSLEDRIVKEFFKKESERCVCPPELPVCVCGQKGRLRILTKRPIGPSEEEQQRNPRSRSAKLRAAEII